MAVYSAYSWTPHIPEYALHCIFGGICKNPHGTTTPHGGAPSGLLRGACGGRVRARGWCLEHVLLRCARCPRRRAGLVRPENGRVAMPAELLATPCVYAG